MFTMGIFRGCSLSANLQIAALLLTVISFNGVDRINAAPPGTSAGVCNFNPHAKGRFKSAFLDRHCQKKTNWLTAAATSVNKVITDLLSPKQMDYFNEISSCKDLTCLCSQMPWCAGVQEIFNKQMNQFANADVINKTLDSFSQLFGKANNFGEKNGKDKEHDDNRDGEKEKNNNRDGEKEKNNGRGKGKRRRQATGEKITLANRKEYRMMSDSERKAFQAALNKLKFNKIDDLSKYDILTVYHSASYSPGAHFGPALLPFHRELLNRLEVALRLIDPNVALPYWDSTLDDALPDPKDSILWTEDFLGNGKGIVTTGPFASWVVQTNTKYQLTQPGNKIQRDIGGFSFASLFKPQDLEDIWAKKHFRELTYCVDPFLELVHGGPHMWVGGHMVELEISPNDPVFFMHHCFIDYIWEQFRLARQDRPLRETEYVDSNETCSSYHNPEEEMKPFKIKNKQGLSNNYTDQMFNYTKRPVCTVENPDCGSPYIFCDTRSYRCASKIRQGGNCTGFEAFDACHLGKCVNSICVASNGQPVLQPTPAPTTTTRTTATPTQPQTPGTTLPPAPTTQPPIEQPDTVWFPITILREKDLTAVPIDDASIITTQRDSTKQFSGGFSTNYDYPNFPGVAYAQAPNPAKFPGGTVDGRIEVKQANGELCQPLCYQDTADGKANYDNCDGLMHLDSSPAKRAVFDYALGQDQAEFLNFNGPIRRPVIFLFMCSISQAVIDNAVANATKAASTKPLVIDATCTNRHRCCSLWGSVGECGRNFDWMGTACEKSCKVCQPAVPDDGSCKDLSSDCAKWKEEGQCDTNPDWMEENCQRSCEVCSRGMDEIGPICGQPTLSECQDLEESCNAWAKSGECTNNPWWMSANCPVSCNACKSPVERKRRSINNRYRHSISIKLYNV